MYNYTDENGSDRCFPIKALYKSQAEAEHYLNHANITRIETLPFLTWEVKEGNKMPLVDFNITETQAFEICKKYNVLSPAYEDFNRLGCWFCHKQTNKALGKVIDMYPNLYGKLEELDKDSHIKFKQKFSAKDIKIKLSKEKK